MSNTRLKIKIEAGEKKEKEKVETKRTVNTVNTLSPAALSLLKTCTVAVTVPAPSVLRERCICARRFACYRPRCRQMDRPGDSESTSVLLWCCMGR